MIVDNDYDLKCQCALAYRLLTEVCCMTSIINKPKNDKISYPCSEGLPKLKKYGWTRSDNFRAHTRAKLARYPNLTKNNSIFGLF